MAGANEGEPDLSLPVTSCFAPHPLIQICSQNYNIDFWMPEQVLQVLGDADSRAESSYV